MKSKLTATVRFEDHGQDFLEWDIERGVVVGCRPFQGSVWGGARVLNQRARRGTHLRIHSRGDALMMKYPLASVGPLKPAAKEAKR